MHCSQMVAQNLKWSLEETKFKVCSDSISWLRSQNFSSNRDGTKFHLFKFEYHYLRVSGTKCDCVRLNAIQVSACDYMQASVHTGAYPQVQYCKARTVAIIVSPTFIPSRSLSVLFVLLADQNRAPKDLSLSRPSGAVRSLNRWHRPFHTQLFPLWGPRRKDVGHSTCALRPELTERDAPDRRPVISFSFSFSLLALNPRVSGLGIFSHRKSTDDAKKPYGMYSWYSCPRLSLVQAATPTDCFTDLTPSRENPACSGRNHPIESGNLY